MKKTLFALLMLPLVTFAQDKKNGEKKPFEGWKISDCQKYALQELTKGDKGELKAAANGHITPETKTIYIAKQKWLQNLPDTVNGIQIKYIDINNNLNDIAKDVKKNHAAVYYVSPFEMKSTICEMWLFPVEVKKGLGKAKQEYSTTAYKMNFFFNYDPPKYEYRGAETVEVE